MFQGDRFKTFLAIVQSNVPIIWCGVEFANYGAMTPGMRAQVKAYIDGGGSIKPLLKTDGLYTRLCTMPSMRRNA